MTQAVGDRRKRRQLLHNSLNRNRFKDKIMQQFKVLQRPLRVSKDGRRCRACSRHAMRCENRHEDAAGGPRRNR
ncbi:hypothetical protein ELI02_18555 [Rhizobium leguminosarum]|uniref:Uncharacterized protein n=1 Tax=Rhizobium leguminosarum TaxID=384 RepID=A0A4Q8Y7K2_RHILE|nr:hypothetical protein ELI01_20995 [Rhizobium leguminosarum]TAX61883.1 hypothetical protein ELI02_18555 [Rhizobium leguminosarum]TAX73855.1 hypothetical protein ELI03_19840 [Rhizobium leguminosarum]TAY03412.1 hypothetical protein ELH95_21060 [Rhizobium leguminosarum]